METIARVIDVAGRVQGVGFRWSTEQAARAAGVSGWVRNLPDGRVATWIEGAPDAVEGMLAWLRRGPAHARVDSLDVRPRDPAGHADFTIRR